MKSKIIIPALICLAAMQSCTIFSIHPLYEDGETYHEPELEGVWKDFEDDDFVSFEKLGNDMYKFRYMEYIGDSINPAYDTITFEAGLVKVGSHFFLDLYPHNDGGDVGDYLFKNYIPTHSFLKLEWENEKLKIFLFSYDRMKELFEQNRIRIKHEMMEDFIVITAATQDLKKFFEKYADDELAFEDPDVLYKLK